jgi:hypothetical protein
MTVHAKLTITPEVVQALEKWCTDRARLEPQGVYTDVPREAVPFLRALTAIIRLEEVSRLAISVNTGVSSNSRCATGEKSAGGLPSREIHLGNRDFPRVNLC